MALKSLYEAYQRIPREKIERTACWALFISIVLYYPRFGLRSDHTTMYQIAGTCLLEGKPFLACTGGLVDPPLFGLLMVPFSFLPPWLMDIVWYLISITSLYFSFKICDDLVRKSFDLQLETKDLYLFRFLAVMISMKFIFANLENHAYDHLTLLLILIAIHSLMKEKVVWPSLAIGLAAALKPTPLLFVPYFLFRKNWAAATLTAVFYVFISFLPDILLTSKETPHGYFFTWMRDIGFPSIFREKGAVPYAFWEGTNELNQSLGTLVFRLTAAFNLSPYYKEMVYGIYGIFATVLFGTVYKTSELRAKYVLDGSLLVIGMLMLSPHSNKSHFITLVLPHMVLLGYLFKERLWDLKKPAVYLLLLSFALNSLTSRGILGKALSSFLLLKGCITIGTLLLFTAIAIIVFDLSKGRELLSESRFESGEVSN